MICLIMIYYQLQLFELSNYYDHNFSETIDIFNIVRKGRYEDYMEEVMSCYESLLLLILEEFDTVKIQGEIKPQIKNSDSTYI